MAIFLDSANLDDARRAQALGFVAGITTNPSIIAREARPAYDVIQDLLAVCEGIVFHQLQSATREEMCAEAERFHALAPARVGMKVPCTLTGLAVVAQLAPRMTCAVTTIFAPAQALLASEAGARYVIPYVNRSTRLLGDGVALVAQMAEVCARAGRGCEVMAASLKSVDEVTAATLHGARHFTAPWAIIAAMAEHPLSQQAIAEFDAAAHAAAR